MLVDALAIEIVTAVLRLTEAEEKEIVEAGAFAVKVRVEVDPQTAVPLYVVSATVTVP